MQYKEYLEHHTTHWARHTWCPMWTKRTRGLDQLQSSNNRWLLIQASSQKSPAKWQRESCNALAIILQDPSPTATISFKKTMHIYIYIYCDNIYIYIYSTRLKARPQHPTRLRHIAAVCESVENIWTIKKNAWLATCMNNAPRDTHPYTYTYTNTYTYTYTYTYIYIYIYMCVQ